MELPQAGGCECGAVRYEITQPPTVVYTCHCHGCQRMSSGAFTVAMVLPPNAFKLLQGQPVAIQRTAESGRVMSRWVCANCGSWICVTPVGPGPESTRNVRSGSLDDTSWLRPTVHFWTCYKQPWVALPEGGQVFETQPADLPAFLRSFS